MRIKYVLAAIFVTVLAVAAVADWTDTPTKGSAHAASATTDVWRIFRGPVSHLSVAPATQDITMIHYPNYADQDTFTIRSGDVMTWDDLDIYGFRIFRDSATVVDVYWW